MNNNFFKQDLYSGLYGNRNMSMTSLYSPEEGYNRGNMFSNLYDPYKNYNVVTLSGNNEHEKMFLELARVGFAKHEINLYLDLHPDDTSMITLFNDYREKERVLTKEYEERFGPITTNSDVLNQTPFMWVKERWPWEVDRNV